MSNLSLQISSPNRRRNSPLPLSRPFGAIPHLLHSSPTSMAEKVGATCCVFEDFVRKIRAGMWLSSDPITTMKVRWDVPAPAVHKMQRFLWTELRQSNLMMSKKRELDPKREGFMRSENRWKW